MDLSYYPGCTLKTKAKGLEDSAIAAMNALGVRPVESERWNCRGPVCSLRQADLAHPRPRVRKFTRVNDGAADRVAVADGHDGLRAEEATARAIAQQRVAVGQRVDSLECLLAARSVELLQLGGDSRADIVR